MTQNALKTFRFVRLALMAGVGFPLILASNAFATIAGSGCACRAWRSSAVHG